MEVNSKAFWEKVKEEYDICSFDSSYYICNRSPTFKHIWGNEDNQYEEIKNLARDFLGGYHENSFLDLTIGYSLLFYFRGNLYPHNNKVRVRVDFIDWCIAKFS